MLKLTYTENSFRLEHLDRALEDWVITRTILALRAGTTLYLEPSTAAFILPRDLPNLADLEKVIQWETGEGIELSPCDAETVEVSLAGTWLASEPESEAGMFVCGLSDRAESLLMRLWQEARLSALALNE